MFKPGRKKKCLTKLDRGNCQCSTFKTPWNLPRISFEKTEGLLQLRLLRCWMLYKEQLAICSKRNRTSTKNSYSPAPRQSSRLQVAAATLQTLRNLKIRGSATSTSQSKRHAVRLSGLRSTKRGVMWSPVWE